MCYTYRVSVCVPSPLTVRSGMYACEQTYNADVPPLDARVQVQWQLVQLVAISTSSQTVTMLGWWRMYWLDLRLAWDPKDPVNKGIERMVFDIDNIWRPDEFIYEAISESAVEVAATVFYDGSVGISVVGWTS